MKVKIKLLFIVLPVLILPAAVVCVQYKVGLTEAVVVKEVMEEGDDAVCPLPNAHLLVNEVVDL